MRAGTHLKGIATPATGLNHVDLEAAQQRNIQVLSLRGETQFLQNIYATAEHTLALTFALLRNIPAACLHVSEGGWNRDLFRGRELHGKTAGVIGYGRVGRMVARYLQALGMRVLATDPKLDKADVDSTGSDAGILIVPMQELLGKADLVSLHVALSAETNGMFGRAEFAQMKPGAWLVNTSRGELVDEQALLSALQTGRLTGAALDVLCEERSSGMGSHPLVEYARHNDNLIVTPHIGGCTSESMHATEDFLADRVVSFLHSQIEHAAAVFSEGRS